MNANKISVERDQQISDDGDKDQKVVINSLDYDSLAKIIMLLPIPERIAMEKVCTKWKEACRLAWYDIKKYKCKSSIGRSYEDNLLTQSYLKEILLRCGIYLQELSLSDACDLYIMPFVVDHSKNLTSLKCEFNVELSVYNDERYIVQAFTQLDKLKCIEIIVDYSWYETVNLPAIINSLPEEINEIHLFSKSRNLYYRQRRVSMTFKKFKNLQKLTLHSLWSANIPQEIAEITTLVHLNIESFNIPKELNKLVNLEFIDLTMGTVCNEAENLSTEILNTIFCTCKNLKHLDIPPGPYDVAKIPLKKWKNFQNLQYLGIACDMIPDLANTIVEYCKNLKHLRIHNRNHSMDNTALKKLTELKNLDCLILLGPLAHTLVPVGIDEESVIAISNNCKKLKRLEIHYCIVVSSIDGKPLSSPSVLNELSKLQYLEHLNLHAVDGLEDSTIIAVANNCKNLKILDIGNCRAITETALTALTNLENLQKLDVSLLNIITDSFLIKLKGLKTLCCDACDKVTDAGIIQFIKNNPDLEMISICCVDNITIDTVIAADQATKNRTNGIVLHIICSMLLIESSESLITSQWLVVQ